METDMEAESFSKNSIFQLLISQEDLIAYSCSASVKVWLYQPILFFNLQYCSRRDNYFGVVTRLRAAYPKNRGSIPDRNKGFVYSPRPADVVWPR